ncbi:hypothetical protein CFP56_038496 [Quercus suber]|uniref:DUF4220 domain-containing protein n=2 Tax=Quercus suber TaxID=58331 RepID=A0AAW0J271_QUESU|nr:hypothetical protein CFP56_53188 [Quercus suber]
MMRPQLSIKNILDLRTKWTIEMLILVNFALQIILTLFGGRRRYIPGFWIRFTVWSSYLLSSSIGKIVISKLTTIDAKHSVLNATLSSNQTDVHPELKALLAPLVFVQFGNPDSITAYSIEDHRLGLRQLIGLLIQVGVVIWILVRCWTKYKNSILLLPMFVAGITKYGETVWALRSALIGKSGITVSEIDQKETVPGLLQQLPERISGVELILKAYYRFSCLKPHLENWLYQPLYESLPWMSIDAYSAEDVFRITDFVLGFIYDVLYTKAPIIYTWQGCILRIISFLSLVSTLCGFAILSRQDSHKITGKYLVFTYVVLIAAVILELYQIILLPFSEWAILKMVRHHNEPVVMKCLRALGPKSSKWKRWSNLLGQFNLFTFCLHDQKLKYSRMIKFRGIDMELRKTMNRIRVEFPEELKELIVHEMKEVDNARDSKPITQRGQWALERYGCLNYEFKWSVKRDFGKSILIWHIATDICYHSNVQDGIPNSQIEMGKLLSNYMMYALAMRPHMFCTTTATIIFQHAYTKIMIVLRTRPSLIKDEGEACSIFRMEELPNESNLDKNKETMVTSNWYVLRDAQRLSRSLMRRDNRWHIMNSVWVEMLCYAASNCPVDYHAEQLRRGGGLITHVWLLLAYKTDKFYSSD